jgi:hypothetical protein
MSVSYRTVFAWIATLGLLVGMSGPSPAHAADSGKISTDVKKAKTDCQPDLQKFCKDVTPGGGRIASCLDSREDQLSPICRSSWLAAKARVSEKLDQEELAFRDSCRTDLHKFCSKVPSGRGRLLDCLDRNKDKLTPSCSNFRNSLEERLSTLIG